MITAPGRPRSFGFHLLHSRLFFWHKRNGRTFHMAGRSFEVYVGTDEAFFSIRHVDRFKFYWVGWRGGHPYVKVMV